LVYLQSFTPYGINHDTLLPKVPNHVIYALKRAVYHVDTGSSSTYPFYFVKEYIHAKIGLFIDYYNDRDNGYFCVGDANHTPSVSMRAGMEVCTFDQYWYRNELIIKRCVFMNLHL